MSGISRNIAYGSTFGGGLESGFARASPEGNLQNLLKRRHAEVTDPSSSNLNIPVGEYLLRLPKSRPSGEIFELGRREWSQPSCTFKEPEPLLLNIFSSGESDLAGQESSLSGKGPSCVERPLQKKRKTTEEEEARKLMSHTKVAAAVNRVCCSSRASGDVQITHPRQDLLKSDNDQLKHQIVLARKGQQHTGALALASRCVKSSDWRERENALVLYRVLVEKGHAYTDALEAAGAIWYLSESDDEALALIELFRALVKRGRGYPEALKVANLFLDSSETLEVALAGVRLFEDLVKKGQGYEEAIENAERVLDGQGSVLGVGALDIYRALVKRGTAYVEALGAAASGFYNFEREQEHPWDISAESHERSTALGLYQDLVEKGQGYEEAIEAAVEGLASWHEESIDLFRALFEKGQGFQEAFDAAASENSNYLGLGLFKILLDRGLPCPSALRAASEGAKSSSPLKRKVALEIFEALVKKERVYFQALNAASSSIKGGCSEDRGPALRLFKAFFDKGQGFREAISLSYKVDKSFESSDSVIDLTCLLARYTKGIEFAKRYRNGLREVPVRLEHAIEKFELLDALLGRVDGRHSAGVSHDDLAGHILSFL